MKPEVPVWPGCSGVSALGPGAPLLDVRSEWLLRLGPRLVESGEAVPLDEFILSSDPPNAAVYPIAAQARGLTIWSLLDLITDPVGFEN